MFEIVKSEVANNFNHGIVIIVVINFRKYFQLKNNSSRWCFGSG